MSSTTDQIAALAQRLVSGETDVMEPSSLDRARLDFGYESLTAVDAYLHGLHTKNQSGMKVLGFIPAPRQGAFSEAFRCDPRLDVTISCVGAYVGEVIRRNGPADARWANFSELESAHPDTAAAMRNAAPLVNEFNFLRGDGNVTWPTNKVAKFIMNGREDSTYFYAKWFNEEAAEIITAQDVIE